MNIRHFDCDTLFIFFDSGEWLSCNRTDTPKAIEKELEDYENCPDVFSSFFYGHLTFSRTEANREISAYSIFVGLHYGHGHVAGGDCGVYHLI